MEFADLVFAVDSVPAIFAITTDPYIVYTSNIFAILGLRALYFALAAMVHRFEYLKYALSLVLIFIGGKIFWNQLFGKIDPAISLGVTLALLAGGVVVSLLKTPRAGRHADSGRARACRPRRLAAAIRIEGLAGTSYLPTKVLGSSGRLSSAISSLAV